MGVGREGCVGLPHNCVKMVTYLMDIKLLLQLMICELVHSTHTCTPLTAHKHTHAHTCTQAHTHKPTHALCTEHAHNRMHCVCVPQWWYCRTAMLVFSPLSSFPPSCFLFGARHHDSFLVPILMTPPSGSFLVSLCYHQRVQWTT